MKLDENVQPVFVVGVGRSGTSLVHSMLAAHSQLAFPPEINFIRRYLATNKISETFHKTGTKGVQKLLLEDRYIQRMGLEVPAVLAAIERTSQEVTDGIVYLALLHSYAQKIGKPRFGDKDPRSVEYLPLLGRYFPQAYIVHIIRDPRDVLASKKKAAWSRGRLPLLHIAANMVQLWMGRYYGPKFFGHRYAEIVYEQLLVDPERVLRELSKKLDLEFEPVLSRFAEAAKELVTQEEMEWKKETLGELLRDNSGKWRDTLSDYEILVTESACREAMQVGQYQRSSIHVGVAQRMAVAAVCPLFVLFKKTYWCYRALSIWRHLYRAPGKAAPRDASWVY